MPSDNATTSVIESQDAAPLEARDGRVVRRAARSSHTGSTRSAKRIRQREESKSPVWADRLRDHRRRQASVGAILDETFGRFAESDPALWDRRAYLMLVGIAYERLALDELEIPTDELISLAKLLAESRRADTQARGQDGKTQHGATVTESKELSANNDRLPDAFGDVIRQIYGTRIPDPQVRSDDTGATILT